MFALTKPDFRLRAYSETSVLIRLPSGKEVWIPRKQITEVSNDKIVMTDWIAKMKGLK